MSCDLPRQCKIEVTLKCNMSCQFCFNKIYSEKTGNELNTDKMKLIINKIYESGVPIVRFTGGEPLLRNDICELIEYAYSKGLRVWLNTNATLLKKENIEKINECVENILIPFHSINKKYEIERVANQLDGIKVVRCCTVALPENIVNLEDFLIAVRELDLEWEILRPIPTTKDDILITHKDIEMLVEKLIIFNKTFRKRYLISNALPFCSYEKSKVNDVSTGSEHDDGHTTFVIAPDGSAKPSYFITENIGNLLKDSVLDCWNNEFMIKMRNLGFVPKECDGCKYIEKCRGGSRFVAKLFYGSYTSLDPLARINIS